MSDVQQSRGAVGRQSTRAPGLHTDRFEPPGPPSRKGGRGKLAPPPPGVVASPRDASTGIVSPRDSVASRTELAPPPPGVVASPRDPASGIVSPRDSVASRTELAPPPPGDVALPRSHTEDVLDRAQQLH